MGDEDRHIHVQVETREGILLYSDDGERRNRRALGSLTLAILLTEKTGETEVCWRMMGSTMSLVPQMIAEYYVHNPGLREAVEGLYVLARVLNQQLRQGGAVS